MPRSGTSARKRQPSISGELIRILYTLPKPCPRCPFFLPQSLTSPTPRLIDKPGLLTTASPLTAAQKPFAKPEGDWTGKKTDLLGVIEAVHPNALIGTSTVPGAFTERIVRAMASDPSSRPIILPLSNPTRLHEAVPADLLRWTDGRALVATGSPFAPVRGPWGGVTGQGEGTEVEIEVAECNNSAVFPGVGLGCVLSRAERLTEGMLVAAVEGLASMSPALDDAAAPLLPDVRRVREVSVCVAKAVIRAAVADGVATEKGVPEEDGEDGLDGWIREQMWDPVYRPLKLVEMEGASRQARGEMRVVGSLKTADRE